MVISSRTATQPGRAAVRSARSEKARPNAKAKLPGPPTRTFKPEKLDGGPGQLQPLVRPVSDPPRGMPSHRETRALYWRYASPNFASRARSSRGARMFTTTHNAKKPASTIMLPYRTAQPSHRANSVRYMGCRLEP